MVRRTAPSLMCVSWSEFLGDFALGNVPRRAQQGQALLGLWKAAANPPWLFVTECVLLLELLLTRAEAQLKMSPAGAVPGSVPRAELVAPAQPTHSAALPT